jgi:acyl-CoA synthetase (NDP forming)
VAIADALGPFTLAPFEPATREAIGAVLERARLAGIVSVRNPIDLTPILGDADTEAVARAILADPGVDLGVIGCVPMTGALDTLAAAVGHLEDVREPSSVASRLVHLFAESTKPWVAVVDAGHLYDPMAQVLEEGGVPTFRTADRALAILSRWCRAQGLFG